MVMGITIDRWGPAAWNTLHAFAHSVPLTLDSRQQSEFVQLLYLFGAHLPCPKCRDHFKEYLDTHIDAASFSTRDAIVAFVHDAHNDVNVRLGKRVWTLAEHVEVYKLPSGRDALPVTWIGGREFEVIALSVVVFVGLVLGVGVWNKHKLRTEKR